MNSAALRTSLRGALGVGLPLVLASVTGHASAGMLAGLGALWGVSQDGFDPLNTRLPRMLAIAATSGIGFFAGALVLRDAGTGWPVGLLLGLTALIAGWFELGSSTAAAASMHLLLGAVVASGLPMPGPWWGAGVAVTVGALWMVALALISSRGRSESGARHARRHAVGELYRTLGVLLREVGTPGADIARVDVARAITVAHEAIAPLHGRDLPYLRLMRDREDLVHAFFVAVQIEDVARSVTAPQAVRHVVVQALDEVAAAIEAGSGLDALARVRATNQTELARVALDAPALGRVVRLLTAPPPAPDRLDDSPAVPGLRERARFALLLTSAVVGGAVLAWALHGPRAYWLPLAVAFIFRPSLGPVLRRALARTTGTGAGALIALVMSLTLHNLYAVAIFAAVCAAVMPLAAQRSYGLTVAAFTPIVFVFLDLVGNDHGLFATRVLDTAIAGALVLGADLLIWSRAPSRRGERLIEQAEVSVADYTDELDPANRLELRRLAMRRLEAARTAVALDAREPQRRRRPSREVTERLDAAAAKVIAGAR